jgi:antitoxin component YwqK of YwqJK toxin-antitoxin module
MIKHCLIPILFLTLQNLVYGQIEMPFYGYNLSSDYKIIKKDSTGCYFYATNDSSKIVFISEMSTYKLFDRNYKLIVEGNLGGRIYVDYYKRFGKWTEYFDNGKIKATGFYYADQPIGQWQFYYPNGELEKTYSIALVETDSSRNFCMIGSYQEFYDNGQLKTNGFYKSSIDTNTIEKWDSKKNEDKLVIVLQPVGKKFGIWSYYKQNGNIEKEEEFND